MVEPLEMLLARMFGARAESRFRTPSRKRKGEDILDELSFGVWLYWRPPSRFQTFFGCKAGVNTARVDLAFYSSTRLICLGLDWNRFERPAEMHTRVDFALSVTPPSKPSCDLNAYGAWQDGESADIALCSALWSRKPAIASKVGVWVEKRVEIAHCDPRGRLAP